MSHETQKPFHESIVDALYQSPQKSLACLGNLIMATKIPKNHDQIIEAWNACTAIGEYEYPRGVAESIERQKTAQMVAA